VAEIQLQTASCALRLLSPSIVKASNAAPLLLSTARLGARLFSFHLCFLDLSDKMQSVQRQFGKFMKRSADDSQVSVLLKDFEEADLLLAKVGSTSLEYPNSSLSHHAYAEPG
jgi:hypothetical protein